MTAAPSPRAVWIAHTLIIIDDDCGESFVDELLATPALRRQMGVCYIKGLSPAEAADHLIGVAA